MEPVERVLYYFEEISKIPRASGDEAAIADYLVDFATEKGLNSFRDNSNNVIIKKPASVENCACSPVIIQGHTDIVYVREDSCDISYEQGLKLRCEDGWITADGTTLGADNGIAVAFSLALLESSNIPHPALEAVFTSGEEIGLLGAAALDCSKLSGKYLFNLDTEEEGVFFTSCAGAFRNELIIPTESEMKLGGVAMDLEISCLNGGHSGMEIHRGRGNAISLLGRALTGLCDFVSISSIFAEGKMNAIAVKAGAKIYCNAEKFGQIKDTIQMMEKEYNHELLGRDEVYIRLTEPIDRELSCYTDDCKKRILSAISLIPCGVVAMSFDVPGLVESSANIGAVENEDNNLKFLSCARSCVGSRKEQLLAQYAAIAALCGGESVCTGNYPEWEHQKNSPLRTLSMECYRELFGIKAEEKAIHAGLECGFFAKSMPDVDIISFGPNQMDVHTTKERVELASIDRVWQLTQAILEKLSVKGA